MTIPYYIQMLQEGNPNQSHAGSDRLIGREDCSQTFNHQALHFSNWDDCIFAYIDPIKINHSWSGKYTIHGIVFKILVNPSAYPVRRCLGTQNPLQNHLQKGLEHRGNKKLTSEIGASRHTLTLSN